jgi:alpha-1,6-mannosyltransferase
VPLLLAAAAVQWVVWKHGRLSASRVVAGAILFRLIVFWMPPSLSDDAYRYVWDGMVQQDGLNPFVETPESLTSYREEPIYPRLNSPGVYTVYPPLSQAIFYAGGLVYDLDWRASFYLIKALFVLLEIAGVVVLARLTAPALVMLYAWNPLVVIEVAGQAHTEAAAVLFVLLALLLVRRGRGNLAACSLVGAGWIKLYPFLLVPFLFRRFGWKPLAWGAAFGALLAAPYAAEGVLANVRQSLDLYVRYFEFNAGPYYALKGMVALVTGLDASKVLGPLMQYAFLAIVPVLYLLDRRRGWSFETALLVLLAAFLLSSTTIHPWYLLPILAVAAASGRPAWNWHALSVLSGGTYLLYAGGPYWTFVYVGWGVWALLTVIRHQDALLQWILRRRAAQKADWILGSREAAPLHRVLDLGAAEGYVGDEIGRRTGAAVEVADVIPLNRTPHPLHLYDGQRLPFADDTFDLVVLSYVLHHAEQPDRVLREAGRVGREVVVVESLVEGRRQEQALRWADILANWWRSGRRGRHDAGPAFRRAAAWRLFFEEHGFRVRTDRRRPGRLHPRALFVLEPEKIGVT